MTQAGHPEDVESGVEGCFARVGPETCRLLCNARRTSTALLSLPSASC